MHRELVTIIEQEGEIFVASCPDFPAANGRGLTMQESWKNLVEEVEFNPAEPVSVLPISQIAREPFEVKPFHLGLPPEWTSHKVEDLLDILEGPDRKW